MSKLAINDGTPVRRKPWRESNAIGKEEKKGVARVMDRGRLSLYLGVYKPAPPYNFLGGPEVQALERLAKKQIGVPHVVAVNSATSGLMAAIGALGLGFGDEVIVSPYTMSACTVVPLWYGAIPVFADIELDTGCLDPKSIRKQITPRTKAILVIHQFGIPANMGEIMKIAREHKLKVIEDCAQAWGAKWRGKPVGTIGDIGVFSFNVHKTIQCGEGGLCVTKDPELAFRLQMIRNHGESVVADAKYTDITNIVGCNFRMTEIQAAIAQAQLKKLKKLNAVRTTLVRAFARGIEHFDGLHVLGLDDNRQSTYYVCPIRFFPQKCHNLSRADFVRMMKAEGIPFGEGYVKPLYLLPIFQRKVAFKHGYPWSALENKASKPNYEKGICPNAERLYEKELIVFFYLCYPQKASDVKDIVRAIKKVMDSISPLPAGGD